MAQQAEAGAKERGEVEKLLTATAAAQKSSAEKTTTKKTGKASAKDTVAEKASGAAAEEGAVEKVVVTGNATACAAASENATTEKMVARRLVLSLRMPPQNRPLRRRFLLVAPAREQGEVEKVVTEKGVAEKTARRKKASTGDGGTAELFITRFPPTDRIRGDRRRGHFGYPQRW